MYTLTRRRAGAATLTSVQLLACNVAAQNSSTYVDAQSRAVDASKLPKVAPAYWHDWVDPGEPTDPLVAMVQHIYDVMGMGIFTHHFLTT